MANFTRKSSLRKRVGRPAWAPLPIDAPVSAIRPVQGWALLEELSTGERRTSGGLYTAALIDTHTVFGRVSAIHPDDEKILGIGAGEIIIYREWSGGRWSFLNEVRLLTPCKDILAKVDNFDELDVIA